MILAFHHHPGHHHHGPAAQWWLDAGHPNRKITLITVAGIAVIALAAAWAAGLFS